MANFSINTNMGAMNAYTALAKTNDKLYNAQLKIATTSKINKVSDDVSGYNVGKSLQQKVAMMTSAQKNISSAKDMLATAESALSLVKDKLTTIRGYISDATDPTKDRKALADNIVSLGNEIKQIFDNTKFNNTKLLEGTTAAASFSNSAITTSTAMGSIAASFSFQVGADVTDRITLDFASKLASTGNNYDSLDISGSQSSSAPAVSKDVFAALSSFANIVSNAKTAFSRATNDDITQTDYATTIASLANNTNSASSEVDNSIIGKLETMVNDALGKIGNYDVRLDVKNEYLTSAITNATSSIQNIFDTNVAEEQLNVTKLTISSQLATSMLSSLNSQPQNILSLFR